MSTPCRRRVEKLFRYHYTEQGPAEALAKMGEIEINSADKVLILHSHIITYGNAAGEAVTESIRDEIETMWNEIHGSVRKNGTAFNLVFHITASFQPGIQPLHIYQNLDPRNNYFRIEKTANHNISFVDGLGCNSGYFLLENLYKGSTTAAHEYGHTLALEHPRDIDYRGRAYPVSCIPVAHW